MNQKILEISLLACKANVEQNLIELKNENINHIHYDVMDHNYGCAFNEEYLNLLNSYKFNISIHIMAHNPFEYINQFLKYNPKMITFQCEPLLNDNDLNYQINNYLKIIKEHKILAGIAIDPYTESKQYENLLKECDLVTIMSVVPGKGGQPFLDIALKNLEFVFLYRQQHHLNYLIQIDGGININTINKIINYTDLIVCGTGYINNNYEQRLKLIEIIKSNH